MTINMLGLQALIGAIAIEEGVHNVSEIRVHPFDFCEATKEVRETLESMNISFLPDSDVPEGTSWVVHTETQ